MSTQQEISWDDLKRMLAELVAQSKETDRRMQETDRRMQETERHLQETSRLIRELRESGRETDRRIERRLRELERQLGGLGNRLGQFVQDMVQPAVLRLFQERGIAVHQLFPNAVARNDAGEAIMEIDLLAVDGQSAVAVECKSRLTTADIDEHVERLTRFKEAFPQFADKVLYGAVAAMGVSEEAIRHAERAGLWVLAQADDDVVVKNRPGFEPKSW